MKLAALLVAACLAAPAHAADRPAPAAPAARAGAAAATATAVIPVKGMSCGGCVAHVNEEVGKVPGVKSVDTSLDDARTTVVYDPAKVSPEQLAKAIAKAGYEPGKPVVKERAP